MKNFRILLFLLVAILFASSCKKEELKDYYSALGTIGITNDSTIITSDNGYRLLVVNSNLGSTIKDKDRLIAEFTLVNQTVPKGIDYIIEIASFHVVLFKPVIILTSANADSIGDNELSINSIWVVKNYLNLNFDFYGSGQTKHYINLIRHDGTIPTDTVDLEIRHNQKNDNEMYNYTGFVSFDLTSLKNTAADSVILRIKSKEYSNRTFEKCFTYKY
jgi:hypothetical protein